MLVRCQLTQVRVSSLQSQKDDSHSCVDNGIELDNRIDFDTKMETECTNVLLLDQYEAQV